MDREAPSGLVTPEAGHHDHVTQAAVHKRIDWVFRSRETGRVTIAQLPNAPLIAFALFRVMEVLFSPHGDAKRVLHLAGTIALGWWAIEELLRGVNPFRRALGAGGLVFVVLDLVS